MHCLGEAAVSFLSEIKLWFSWKACLFTVVYVILTFCLYGVSGCSNRVMCWNMNGLQILISISSIYISYHMYCSFTCPIASYDLTYEAQIQQWNYLNFAQLGFCSIEKRMWFFELRKLCGGTWLMMIRLVCWTCLILCVKSDQ